MLQLSLFAGSKTVFQPQYFVQLAYTPLFLDLDVLGAEPVIIKLWLALVAKQNLGVRTIYKRKLISASSLHAAQRLTLRQTMLAVNKV
jgi:hypothetical protein